MLWRQLQVEKTIQAILGLGSIAPVEVFRTGIALTTAIGTVQTNPPVSIVQTAASADASLGSAVQAIPLTGIVQADAF